MQSTACALDTKWWNHSLSSYEHTSSIYSFSGNWKVARFVNFSFLIRSLNDTTSPPLASSKADARNSQMLFSAGQSSRECNKKCLFSMFLFLMYHFPMYHFTKTVSYFYLFYVSFLCIIFVYLLCLYFHVVTKH